MTWKTRLGTLSVRMRVRDAVVGWPVLIVSLWVGLLGISCLMAAMVTTFDGAFSPVALAWLAVGAAALAFGYRLWRSGRA